MTGRQRRMPMFPLSTVLFPGASLALRVFEPRYQALVRDCLAADRAFGVVLIRRGHEVGGGDLRHDVGTVAHIKVATPRPDGRWTLACQGGRRLRVVEWLVDDPYPNAVIETADPPGRSDPATSDPATSDPATSDPAASDPATSDPAASDPATSGALTAAMASLRRAWALLSEAGRSPALPANFELDPDPDRASWQLLSIAPLSPFDAQRLLEIDGTAARLRALRGLTDDLSGDLVRMLGHP